MEEHKYGLVIWDKFNVDANDVYSKLNSLIHDRKYKNSVKQVSDLWRDLPDGKETVRYWVELLAKHKKLDHLLIKGYHLNVIQYFFVDVIGATIVLLAVGIATFVFYPSRRKDNI